MRNMASAARGHRSLSMSQPLPSRTPRRWRCAGTARRRPGGPRRTSRWCRRSWCSTTPARRCCSSSSSRWSIDNFELDTIRSCSLSSCTSFSRSHRCSQGFEAPAHSMVPCIVGQDEVLLSKKFYQKSIKFFRFFGVTLWTLRKQNKERHRCTLMVSG